MPASSCEYKEFTESLLRRKYADAFKEYDRAMGTFCTREKQDAACERLRIAKDELTRAGYKVRKND